MTVVVKLGGNALAALPAAIAIAGDRPLVLVHGGGAQISRLMRRRDIEPRFVGGRRVTDLAVLACARHALAGVSAELEQALAPLGVVAARLYRGECLEARRVVALGLVGTVELGGVDVAPLRAAWRAGRTPLVAPIARERGERGPTHDANGSGRFLNVNADDVAGAVAIALGADELVFLSDVPGVLDADGVVVPRIRVEEPPPVSGGMLPKLAACADALRGGVGQVRIAAAAEGGTIVVSDPVAVGEECLR